MNAKSDNDDFHISEEKQNLSKSVYERLKSEIIHWKHKPGVRLPAEMIAKRLGVSRTPVREALRLLAQEKLVVYTPHSGYCTRTIELKGYNELYQVRVVLEEFAVAQATESMDLSESREILEDLQKTWGSRDKSPPNVEALGSVSDDEAFHESIALASGNLYLHELLQSINDRIRSIRIVDFNYPDRIRSTYSEHLEIVNSIIERKTDTAKKKMRNHILNSQAKIRENVIKAFLEADD